MTKPTANISVEVGSNRREFLKQAGYGTLGLMAGGVLPFLTPSAAGQSQNIISGTGFVPDLDISLKISVNVQPPRHQDTKDYNIILLMPFLIT